MKPMRSSLFALLFLSVCGLAAAPAMAQVSQATQQEAVAKYKQGRALIEKKDYDAALRELTESYALLDSPNTLLLMAHAERELGRETKAAGLYEQVVKDANDRVSKGEERFGKTAEDAQGWLDRLSERLGKITVTVVEAPDGTTLRIDGEPVGAPDAKGGTMKVESLWWKAGTVRVEARDPDGRTQAVTVEIPAGGVATTSIDLGDQGKDATEPGPVAAATLDTDDRSGKSIPTASWVTGGIGVAGLAVFAVFGSSAKSKASDLDACSPRCPESERDLADAGKRDQMVANIGLAVGGVGLLSAAGFYIFQADPKSESVDVAIVPNGVLVRGTFH